MRIIYLTGAFDMGEKTVVIIGGGAAGVSTLYQLVELLAKDHEKNTKIIVIEKSSKIGLGLAYGTEIDSPHILNLPSSAMSPIPNKPTHFIEWLRDENNLPKWRHFFPNLDIDKNEYLPRALFGMYLNDLVEATKEYAQTENIQVEFIHDEAIDIERLANNQANIKLLNNPAPLSADNVILCIGHLPPSQKEYKAFKPVKQYYETPWQTQPNMADIPISEDIIILGTRLTAIDAILTREATIEKATQAGYTGTIGKIFAVSRNGLLPCVIGPTKDYQRSKLTLEKINQITAGGTKPLQLKELKKLFKEEIKSGYKLLESKDINLRLKGIFDKSLKTPPTEWLKKEIDAARNRIRPWQTVLASLYSIVPNIWKILNENDKQEFLDKYYSFWITYLAAFPLENAEKILGLLQTGRLAVLGGLHSVSYSEQTQKFSVNLSVSGSLVTECLEAKYLVNAAGQGHDVTQTDSVLLKNLVERHLITPHPLGGVQIHFKSLRSAAANDKTIPIFIVGDGGTWGTCMATADLGQTARQAQRVVYSLMKEIRPYNSNTGFFYQTPPSSPNNSPPSSYSNKDPSTVNTFTPIVPSAP